MADHSKPKCTNIENGTHPHKLSVLLVEDNPGDADFISLLLSEYSKDDFQVECADRLSIALELLEKRNFDVVALDLGLPDSNGLSTISEVKRSAPTVPIVVLTGEEDDATSMAALREGAQEYLVKGKIEADTLTRVLRYAIERHRLFGNISEAISALNGNLINANIAILNDSGEILFVNKAWQEFANANNAGYINAFLGANYLEICDVAKGMDADMAHTFAAGIRSVMQDNLDFFEMEYPCHSPSEERWFCGRATAFPGKDLRHVTIAHENITARKQAEKALRESEIKFRTLFDQTKDALFLADARTGNIIDANPAACEMLGRPKEYVVGMHQSSLHPPEEMETYKEIFRKHGVEAKGNAIDVMLQRTDGTQVPVEISASVMELAGKTVVQGCFRDVSERKQAEELLRQKYEELERFNRLTIDRELRMIELKKEVNTLLKEVGQPPRYKENQ